MLWAEGCKYKSEALLFAPRLSPTVMMDGTLGSNFIWPFTRQYLCILTHQIFLGATIALLLPKELKLAVSGHTMLLH